MSELAAPVQFYPQVLKNVRVKSKPETLADPGVQAAVVTVRTKDGSYTDRVDFPKGEPENPLSDREFRERYDGLMAYAGKDAAVRDAVFDAVYRDRATICELVKEL